MKRLLLILVGISYFIVTFSVAPLKKKQVVVNSISLLLLTFSISSEINRTNQRLIVLNFSWVLFYLVFNSIQLFIYRSSNGNRNLYDNKVVLWGFYVPLNIILAVASYFVRNYYI